MSNTSTTQVPATTKAAAVDKSIRSRLESLDFKSAVAKVLPKHLTPERFVRVSILAVTRTPKLQQCDPASFFGCLMTLSQYGLEPDGRRAHLIPFENRKRGCTECQVIIDWKGLAELAMRSGLVANLHADVVYEGDVFEYSAGRLRNHIPWFLRRDAGKPRAAGDIYAAYAMAVFKDDTSKAEVLSIEEVEGIRRRSKSSNNGPWTTDYNEMAKKTAFRRLSKWLPLSPEFRDAVDKDDELTATEVTPEPTARIEAPAFEIGEMPPEREEVNEDDEVPMGDAKPAAEPPQKPPAQPAAEPKPTTRRASATAPAPAPAPAAKDDTGLITALRGRGIEESEAMQVVRGFWPQTETLSNLKEFIEMHPDLADQMRRSLDDVEAAVKQNRAKA